MDSNHDEALFDQKGQTIVPYSEATKGLFVWLLWLAISKDDTNNGWFGQGDEHSGLRILTRVFEGQFDQIKWIKS
jgi:hypothetical protein